MPSSRPEYIPDVLKLVMQRDPQSVLDIGCGRGKYGLLCREYLQDWNGGERRIDAVEAFVPYITQVQQAIYDRVYFGDALTALPKEPYDLYLLIDVLEHFSTEDGHKLLDSCKGDVLVVTPHVVSEQGAVNGNEYETHRSAWTVADLKQHGAVRSVPNDIALIALVRKEVT